MAAAAGSRLPRGRRQRLAPSHHLEKTSILEGYFLPNEVDLHQVIILPKAEWARIQDSLGSRSREAARILAEKKEREEMHLRSKAAIKDWPNTIMALAQQKLKAKQLREEKEEEERKLLDLEEEQFQAAKRKEAIDRAKTYLYYQNDRVKGLHNALLLAEVLKERDAQLEFKKLKSDVKKKDEEKKDEEKEHEYKEAILTEQQKAHQHYMNQQALCRDQLEQIKEHEYQADLAKLENKREGEQIQRLNQLYQLEIERGKEKEQEKKAEDQRLYHMKMKVEKEREEKEEGKKELHAVMEKNRIHLEMEKAKKQRQRDMNMEVQKIQIQQMVIKEQQLMFTQLFNVPFLWWVQQGREKGKDGIYQVSSNITADFLRAFILSFKG
ncbi:cilia- and flagella- associated protein 210-like isoform 8-T8 [Porphyrio hochstetteri]